MIIDDNLKVAKLIDTYGKLLTDKQYEIMTSYYFDNLTLTEIADNQGISRQAVNDCLTQATKSLESFESKLNLVKKHDTLKLKLDHLLSKSTNDNLTNLINDILQMLDE